MPDESFIADNTILPVKRVSRTDGDYVVKCPHCQLVVAVEGEDLSEMRGEQFQHRRKAQLMESGGTQYVGCDGWLEISNDAYFVRRVSL